MPMTILLKASDSLLSEDLIRASKILSLDSVLMNKESFPLLSCFMYTLFDSISRSSASETTLSSKPYLSYTALKIISRDGLFFRYRVELLLNNLANCCVAEKL